MIRRAGVLLSVLFTTAVLLGTNVVQAQVIKPPEGYHPPVTYQPIPIPIPPGEHRIQVLVITGRSSYEHDWLGTTNAIRRILQDTGRFEVHVTEEFRGATADTLKPYDLVILNYMGRWNYDDPTEVRWGKGPEQALFDFVKRGGGIVVYHSSFSLGLPSWPEFEKLAGGVLQVSNSVATTSRRWPSNGFLLHVADRNDPITKGMRQYMWDLDDDLLANLKWAPGVKVHVLVTAHEDPTMYQPKFAGPKYPPAIYTPENMKRMTGMGQDAPLVWTLNYGKGRVFSFLLGHAVDTLYVDGVKSLLERGAEWAATGKVTIPPEPGAKEFAADH